jgi:hypothetical protein
MPPPSTTAGVLLFAPETPFSRPLRVTPHHRTAASSSSSPPAPPGPPGLVREVFGHLHLRGGGGLSRRLEGLSTDLDMARLYLSIHELDRAERLFEDGVARCRAARPFRGGSALPYRDSGRGVPVAARASSASAQPGYDPLLYASAMVGLARVRIARLRGAGQGQLGVDASSNGDADAWLALPRAAEDAVRLLNGGIRAAAEAGVSAEHLFLGEALGALGELLEVLPDLLGEEHDDHRTAAAAAAAGESREQMRARVSESFVAAIALCAGGIGGHRDAIRQEQSGSGDVGGHPEVSMRQEEEQNGDDPQKRPDAWCENAVIDMVRIQGAAARCVPPGRKAYRFQALARQVAALAIDRFGRQSTVVAQALHDLGRVGAKAQSVSGAHPRDAWDFIEAARQAYEDCGTWSGSTEIVQCLGTLAKASRTAGHLSEGAHDMARSAVNAHLKELRRYPGSRVVAQSLARAVGTFGEAACQSGDVLGAVELEFRAKESMLSDGKNRRGQRVRPLARKDGIARKHVCHRAAAQEELLRRSAGVWARTPRLPRSNPYRLPRAPAVGDEVAGGGGDFVEHLQAKLSPRRPGGSSGGAGAPWSP